MEQSIISAKGILEAIDLFNLFGFRYVKHELDQEDQLHILLVNDKWEYTTFVKINNSSKNYLQQAAEILEEKISNRDWLSIPHRIKLLRNSENK